MNTTVTCKDKTKRVVKDGDFINAFYIQYSKTRNWYSKRVSVEEYHLIGRFSKNEWRKIKVNRFINFLMVIGPWFALFMAVLSIVLASTIFSNNGLFLGLSITVGCVLLVVGIVEIVLTYGEKYGTFLTQILTKIDRTPKNLTSEVFVGGFVSVGRFVFENHVKSISDKDFVELVQKFAEWNEAKEVHRKMDEMIEPRYTYEDKNMYEFLNEKRKALSAKVSENSAEANLFAKNLKDGVQNARMLNVLQEADNILATDKNLAA